jgi:hypothetical protein
MMRIIDGAPWWVLGFVFLETLTPPRKLCEKGSYSLAIPSTTVQGTASDSMSLRSVAGDVVNENAPSFVVVKHTRQKSHRRRQKSTRYVPDEEGNLISVGLKLQYGWPQFITAEIEEKYQESVMLRWLSAPSANIASWLLGLVNVTACVIWAAVGRTWTQFSRSAVGTAACIALLVTRYLLRKQLKMRQQQYLCSLAFIVSVRDLVIGKPLPSSAAILFTHAPHTSADLVID